jgi:hypothetical protein
MGFAAMLADEYKLIVSSLSAFVPAEFYKSALVHILGFSFSIGLRFRAECYKISAQQQALTLYVTLCDTS